MNILIFKLYLLNRGGEFWKRKKSLELIHDKVDKISVQLENAKLADYFELMRNKRILFGVTL